MLSHYSALKVAKQFRVLEGIAPGRIDLGVGRAPGSDRLTSMALNHIRTRPTFRSSARGRLQGPERFIRIDVGQVGHVLLFNQMTLAGEHVHQTRDDLVEQDLQLIAGGRARWA